MEKLFQQLIDQQIRTNELLEGQQQTLRLQQLTLTKLEEFLALLSQRMARIEDLQLQIGEILDRDLLTYLNQPLLDKPQLMRILSISDSTYRNYVREGKLNPMNLGKIDYYFARDLVKLLLSTKNGQG